MPQRVNARPSPRTQRLLCALCITCFLLFGCGRHNANDPASLTLLIESNPTNLDPRFATDSQSQKIDGLLFSSLLERDDQINFHGDLAESWKRPTLSPTFSICAQASISTTVAPSPPPTSNTRSTLSSIPPLILPNA